jgi:hypothetical protein
MKNIFVNATVDIQDPNLVEKAIAKGFLKEIQENRVDNPHNYINKHDYLNWILTLPKPFRREIKTNITTDNYIYPVSVPIQHIIDVESEFWIDLIKTHEPIVDKNIVVTISEKAALCLNGQTFDRFFNHPEFSPCISDLWECSPQNELIGFKSNEVWDQFVEKCNRHLVPSEKYKNKRFLIKCNSDEDYTVFLYKYGIEFDVIPIEYFLYDTYINCGIKSPNARSMMDSAGALDDQELSTEEIMDLIWTDDKKYTALFLNRYPKEHRLRALIEAERRDLLKDMNWSCGFFDDTIYPGEDDNATLDVRAMLPKQADDEPYDNVSSGPIMCKHDRKFNLQWLIDCKINLISESQVRDVLIELDPPHPVRFLTEKSFKPMSYGMPFLLMGARHSLQRLRDIGFKTFPEWFDESYDDEENFNLRMAKMFDALEKFLSEDHSIEEIKDALEHNFNRVHDRFWIMSRMVDPIRIMVDAIENKREAVDD